MNKKILFILLIHFGIVNFADAQIINRYHIYRVSNLGGYGTNNIITSVSYSGNLKYDIGINKFRFINFIKGKKIQNLSFYLNQNLTEKTIFYGINYEILRNYGLTFVLPLELGLNMGIDSDFNQNYNMNLKMKTGFFLFKLKSKNNLYLNYAYKIPILSTLENNHFNRNEIGLIFYIKYNGGVY